jgi:5-methylthioadenosine/S-adenosylhomocysteine deaminase
MTSILLQADTVVTLDSASRIYQPGYLILEDGLIVEIGSQDDLKYRHFDQQINLHRRVLMPGLVNAHTHTPMALFRGIAEGHSLFTFDGWYNTIRVVEQVADASMVPAAVTVSCAEMIRTGTTCFADQYFYMDQIVPVVQKSGLRATLAYGIVEMGDLDARQRELSLAETFLDELHDDPLIQAWIGPHAFFVDNSVDAMKLELELAKKHNTGFHIHFGTDGEEDRYCFEHFGRSAIDMMKELGILSRPVLAAHCITLREEDFALAAGTSFTAVICPSAGMRSGAGAAPLKAMRAAGINTAFGTDNVANNNSYDLFGELQTAAKLMALRERQPAAVLARDILDMATLGGARALGLQDKIGSLEVGKQADLITLDLNAPGWVPRSAQDIYTALVYSVSGMHVCDVMVAGAWLLRDQKWTTLDYSTACQELEEAYLELQQRL